MFLKMIEDATNEEIEDGRQAEAGARADMREGQGTPRHIALTDATPAMNIETAGGMATSRITETGAPLLTGGSVLCLAFIASIPVRITSGVMPQYCSVCHPGDQSGLQVAEQLSQTIHQPLAAYTMRRWSM